MRDGALTLAQARMSPYRHVITRALGIHEEILTDTAVQPLQQGDIFLLCTDGLTEMVGDQEIAASLANSSPRDAVRELVDKANRGGGVDNITVVVIRIAEV
jgi:protein phosphatase